ncbi:hypothetical protein ARMGADRAFT_1031994 [Armillaria gallica]|uniref:Uncharacterized protein n=1 Tax=Armillaria gallica TaxID=47427 RepID=A0A2H3DPA2_ARMGA|nr:hypothetical protein ARMGADRAFT_1031994 [Armillaria gallica]
MQSALAHLCEITNAGDGRQANAFMRAIINNLWTSIGSAPNPILSARYPTKLVGQHLLCWIKEFLAYNVYEAYRSHMRRMDIVIYESYSVKTANDALIKQVILFLDPNWFGWMTPFMCAKYVRIRDINNYRKMQAFERAYEVEVGELGPEGMYSAVLMPVLKVTSNGSIISDWEARPNSRMADEWESNDEGEEEGVSAADLQRAKKFSAKLKLQAELYLSQADLPQHVADPSSSEIGDQSACNCAITCHTRSSDPKEGAHRGLVRKKIVVGSVFKAGPRRLGICCNGKPARRNVARSEESLKLSREVADDKVGMFQEHFEENSRWKYRNFSSDTCEGIVRCGQGVLSDWTEAHARSLYDSIVADPIQHTKNVWTPAHICWMMKSIWFCDKITRLLRVTGVDASILRCQRMAVFRQIRPFIQQFCHASVRENTVHSPSFWRDLSNLVGEYWLATSDPVSSDVDTGPSNIEGDGDEDMGYGAAQSPATPMDVNPPAPEGKPKGNETGEEWWVTSETRADSAAAQAAATLVGLVAYGASSDDGSGEDEGEVEEGNEGEVKEDNEGEVKEEDDEEVEKAVKPKRKSPAEAKEKEKDREANDEREEEEEVDELEGRGASDIVPTLKNKGYTRTSWPADLNQHLRQGKTQPAMHAYMVEMEEEGLLEPSLKQPADKKRRRLLPMDSDNGHPACAECLISSHGCPNHVARATPAKKKATRSDKGKGKAGPAPIKHPQAFVLVPCLKPNSQLPATGEPTQPESFCSCLMQERPPAGHNPVTDFAFNLAEHCLGGMTHPREAAWDQIPTLTHQLIAAHHVLEYKLRRSGPFSAEEVEYLLQTRYPDSMLPPDDEHNEESVEGKGNT